jgi:hypothetical protein
MPTPPPPLKPQERKPLSWLMLAALFLFALNMLGIATVLMFLGY